MQLPLLKLLLSARRMRTQRKARSCRVFTCRGALGAQGAADRKPILEPPDQAHAPLSVKLKPKAHDPAHAPLSAAVR